MSIERGTKHSGKERLLRLMLPIAAVALIAPLPQVAHAQSAQAESSRGSLERKIADAVPKDLRAFYAARDFAPLWLNEFGRPSGAASMLIHHLRTAHLDGVDAGVVKFDRLATLVDDARRGDAADVARAEVQLSSAFAAYVRAMRSADRAGMIYETSALEPVVPTDDAALQAAAGARSLEDYIAEMQWMHPLYAPLREALEDERYSADERRLIAANLARIRAIPAIPTGRHILVDAAGARLLMYEDGKVVDTMKVVVGKPELQTPMMAGFVRYAILNPYWNVPDDLVQTNIASNVINRGVGYLKSGGYEVFESWDENAPKLDPAAVDWRAVNEGRASVRVRQLPGGNNFMGKVKFMFPNDQGIYMHDTPDKHLLKLDERQLSSGCVRLEDAARMHRWLTGAPLPSRVNEVEKMDELPEMVPIFITYLTAMPAGRQIAFHDDPYGRDASRMASGRALASTAH